VSSLRDDEGEVIVTFTDHAPLYAPLFLFLIEFAYFYWYTVVRTLYVKKLTSKGMTGAVQLSTAIELLLGALAGGMAQIFTIPVSVIATRQQLGGGSSSSPSPSASSSSSSTGKSAAKAVAKVADPSDPDSFLGVARDIMKQDGITGFWRGLKPSLVLTVNPAITYGVYEREWEEIKGKKK
jgi:adenine nucleotide transporter 17